jgi:4-hydroxy-4-methyl-2-oxoglutarate aldolase
MTDVERPFVDRAIPVAPCERPPASVIAELGEFGTATLHEAAGRIGALPAAIKPVAPGFRLAGPAFTVHGPGADNLWLHRALATARPGDVLVAYVSGVFEAGYWGEIMSVAASARQLGGLVIDGCVRDSAALARIGFPVFARGLCIRGTGKDFGARGWLNQPLSIGDVIVHPGDVIVGDEDGVIALPQDALAGLAQRSADRETAEVSIMERLRAGATTLSVYRLDR